MKRILSTLLVAAALQVPVRAQLLINGSFESPDVVCTQNNGFVPIEHSSTPFVGWTTYGTSTTYVEGYVIDGTQCVTLAPNHTSAISQAVTTIPNVTYAVGLIYARHPNVAGTPLIPSEIVLKANDQALAIFGYSNPSGFGTAWHSYYVSFVATASITELKFESLGSNGEYGGYLDRIVLYEGGVGVPEPPTIILLAGGLGWIALFKWKRSRRNAN